MHAGIVGEVNEGSNGEKEYHIWTRKKLEIGYHDNQVSASVLHALDAFKGPSHVHVHVHMHVNT